uniref:Ig-like domain-containing protein n=1 Tax=Panagrolaimus davidi TaxID=227884 RepID=A0A914QC56_9BILA
MNNKTERYNKCIKTLTLDEIYLYSFKRNNSYNISALSVFEDVDDNLHDAILTCVCRDTYDPIFFISPFLNKGTFEDVYFYCVLGNPESFGIYDDYEIYDNFLFEYIKTIPNTLMTPLKDDDNSEVGCYDEDGFLTKSIGNQKTCFFALEVKDSESFHESEIVYSGPLIYSQLSNFVPNVSFFTLDAEPSCYTSVKNTTFKPNDSCIYILSDSVFLCCCSQEHKNCKIQKEKLYCAPSVSSNTSYEWFDSSGLSFEYNRTPMLTYLNESVNYACGIKISTKAVNYTVNVFVYYFAKFEVEYISLNSCSDETTVDISESRFCSSVAEKPQNIEIQKCCKSGHFCNLHLTSIEQGELKLHKCSYKPDVSFHFDEISTCELYYDLTLQKRVYHHENFTTKIIHRTWYKNYSRKITFESKLLVSYHCYYIYAEIINVDSKECSEQPGLIKPFYHCTCEYLNCDAEGIVMRVPDTKFICQHLVKTDFKNAKNGVKDFDKKGKWICYVQIDFYFEGSKVNAGHLDIEKDKTKECLIRDIYQNDFCCVKIVNIEQKDTDCTVEKLLKQYNVSKHSKRNPSENHDANSQYITCLSKDILNIESESCPKTGGCFSTRILLPSGITSTDAIEPAGCLGYAEKYATLNLPLTSLSLGCRTNENSNCCSVVYGPNGEQRIVCCCNENDGNGFCNTNLKEVPQSVGRSIKSFKSLN